MVNVLITIFLKDSLMSVARSLSLIGEDVYESEQKEPAAKRILGMAFGRKPVALIYAKII
jgi:hypothetical protein